jgi:hypothetical protein
VQVFDAVCALPGANPGVAAFPCRSDRDRRAICARTFIACHPPVPTHIQSNQRGLMGGTLVEKAVLLPALRRVPQGSGSGPHPRTGGSDSNPKAVGPLVVRGALSRGTPGQGSMPRVGHRQAGLLC